MCEECSYQPDEDAVQKSVQYTLSMMRPAKTTLPQDLLTYEHFRRVILSLERQSSPGIPYCYDYPTIDSFLYTDSANDLVNEINVHKLWLDIQDYINGEREAYPLRVFVKGEPVDKQKYEEGRFRLITAVSLPDMVLDQMLFGSQNNTEIELFAQLPTMPGWSTTYGGWKCIDSQAIGYDRKAWDYSVPLWVLRADKEVRKELCVNATPEWIELVDRRYHDLYENPLLQLSDGTIYRQKIGGIVKSGTVITISTNTHCQILLHGYVCSLLGLPYGTYFIAMGDDTLQSKPHPSYVEELGKIVKLKEPVKGEFCSYQFYPGGRVEPVRLGRHLHNLAYQNQSFVADTLRSLQVIYGLSKRLPRFRQLALEVAPESYLFDSELKAILDY